MPEPSALYTIARRVLEVTAEGCTQAGLSVPDRRYVADGSIVAWDCEQLVVAVEGGLSHQGDVSVEDATPLGCTQMRAATLGVWHAHCSPVIEEAMGEPIPPSADEIDANAQLVLAWPATIWQVLLRAQKAGELASAHGLSFSRWTAVGPAGGFTGGVLRLTVDLTAV